MHCGIVVVFVECFILKMAKMMNTSNSYIYKL